MADDHSSIQVLLIEGPSINNGAPGFIEEEIVCSIPDDIEVIQLNNLPEVNFNKPLLPSKPLLPKKQPAPKAKQKRTAAERAKARANKIQPLITLPEPPADSCIDVCGLKVPVKTLLENSDIRKQLAPFIEEIVVSDISDSSDVEEIGKVQRKKAPVIKKRKKQMKPPSSKKRKKSPEPKVKEGTGPFVEVLIPDVPDSTELLGEDIIVNLPLAIEKDAIHDTQKMCVLEEQIQLVTDSSDDEPVVEQRNNGMQKKQILFKKVNLVNRSKSNGLVHTKFKNTAEKIPNSQVVVLDDALKENYKCQDNNLDKNNGQEASVMESDDWYYLNIANTPKINSNSNTKKSTNVNDYSNNEKSTNVNDTSSTAKSTNGNSNTIKSKKFDDNLSMKTPSKVDDNSSMKTSKLDDNLTVITISEENDERIKNGSLVESLPVKSDQGMPNKEPEIETAKPRKRKKRRRIPWSRHAIRGTRVSKYVKAKLQGKIVKGGVKNVINDNQDTTRKSNVMPKKAENADPSSVQKNATNNAPKTSILDKTNINHNSVSKKEPLPVVYRGKSFADSKEPTLTIKQEPMLENNVNETTTEVSDVNEVNEEIDKNKLRIKLEQEVSWNTDVNYQNSYIQEKLNEPSINPHPIQRSITTRQKQSKITAKRMFFGRRRMIGKCDNCGKKYERLGALRRHQLVCKVSYECAMCIFSTSDKIAFREHLANHILGTNNVHQEVEQSNGPVNNLMAHCSTCSEDSTAVEGLNKCQKCLGYLEYYRCKICEKLFEDYSSLRKHILTSLQGAQIAQSQRDTDQCSRCGANSFSSKCEFRSHLVSKCRPKKTIPMKIPYVRLERCNIPQKLTKVTETQQYHAKSYCPKCSITSVATKGVIECDKCQSKLSFICQVCCNLSITHADLRTHMFSAHSIDLHEYTENSHVPEQKCLSIEKGKSCKKVKPLYEKEHIIQDPTRYREEHVVNSKENTKIFSIYNKTSSLPAIRQVARFDKKIPIQNQKPNIGTVMKIDSPIKRVASNSIETEKQVPVLKTLEKSNSDHSINKYFNKYSVKVVNSQMVDGLMNKTKFLNRKIKSSIMRMQKQCFKQNNSAFEKEFNNVRYSLSKKTKLGLANQIKRFCIKCDKTKKYYEKIKMGLTREICRKCKMQLLYQCKNCHGICQDYQKMIWHMLFRCRPRLRFFSVSHKSHLRKILETRYALLEAQQNIFDSIASQS